MNEGKLTGQRLEGIARAAALRTWLIAVAVIIGVHLPLLIGLVKWLSDREHYSFFPVILIGFSWLLYVRVPLIQIPAQRVFSLRVLLYLLVAAIVFAAAVSINSGFLGILSCLLALWASVWCFAGRSGVSELRGPFVFLAMMVPLPLNLDLQLINALQLNASQLASTVLDLRGLRHQLFGVVLRTASKSYMVEEACSGINSLFSATAFMLILSVYNRYSWIRVLLTLATTALWVVVANATRVFLVVFVEDRYGYSLESGWRHEALGIFTYGFAVLMSLSSDQLFRFFLPVAATSVAELKAEFAERFKPPSMKWMRRLLDMPLVSNRLAMGVVVLLCCAAFIPLGVVSFLRQANAGPDAPQSDFVSDMIHDQLDSKSLPIELSGWERVQEPNNEEFPDPLRVKRGDDDPMGLDSTMWSYNGYGFKSVFSLDGNYPEWHDLAYCYAGSGWHQVGAENGSIGSLNGSPIYYTKLDLYQNSGQHATVLFSCFDSLMTPVEPPPVAGSFLRMLEQQLQRILSGILTPGDSARVVPPVFQLQLLVEAESEFLPHEQQAFLELFVSLRDRSLNGLKEAN